MRLGAIRQAGLSDLGTAQSTAEIEGGLSVVSSGLNIVKAVTSGLTAIPIVGSVVAGLEAIVSLFHIGQGCGAACVDSATTEQIFEVAGWDVELAATAGQITQAQAAASLQWLLQQGQAAMTALERTDSKAAGGLTNLTKSIQEQIQSVQSNNLTASDFSGEAGPSATPGNPIPTSAPTATLDASMLEGSVFVQPGASGWEPNVVSQGASLALQAIADATNQVQTASTPASGSSGGIVSSIESALSPSGSSPGSIVGQVESAFSGMSNTTLLLVAALGIGGLFLLTGGGTSTRPNPRPKLKRRRGC